MALLIDLDNTLVDRDKAFATWSESSFLRSADPPRMSRGFSRRTRGGYTPRASLTDGLLFRLRPDISAKDLLQAIMMEHLAYIGCYPGVLEGLEKFRSRGEQIVIVTNGTVAQQSRKIELSGLDSFVDRVVISEAVGAKKPAPEIFTEALRELGPARDSWMVGDNPRADIVGGQLAGLQTGWVSHGSDWTDEDEPTVSRTTTVGVLEAISEMAQ